MSYPPPRRLPYGFTLMELLVTVGIICLLAGLLLPSLGLMQQRARTVRCSANLRQIAAGFQMYAGENSRRVPPFSYTGTDGTISSGLIQYIGPYLSTTALRAKSASGENVFICPEAWQQHGPDATSKSVSGTYGTNGNLNLPSVPDGGEYLSAIQQPSKAIWIADGRWISGQNYWARDVNSTTVATAAIHPNKLNDKSLNCLFFDGHVSALAQSIASDSSNWKYQ